MDFFSLGLTHGMLSQQYQPVRLPLPSGIDTASREDQHTFWTAFNQGWAESEADTITFIKLEV